MFEKLFGRTEKSSGGDQGTSEKIPKKEKGEKIGKHSLGDPVYDELVRIEKKYSLSNDVGLFNCQDCYKLDLGNGKQRYTIVGTISLATMDATRKSTPVEFIIETDGINITLSEEKRGSTEVVFPGKGYIEDHDV